MITTTTKDYYECVRCGINTSFEYRICPCNRKPCDAIKKGIITITKNITLDEDDFKTNGRDRNDDIGQMLASWNV